MSESLDRKSLIALCLLVLRRRRRLRQRWVHEPAIHPRLSAVRKNFKPVICHRQKVVRKNRGPFSNHIQEVIENDLEAVICSRQNMSEGNQEPEVIENDPEAVICIRQNVAEGSQEPLINCQLDVVDDVKPLNQKGKGPKTNRKWWVHPSLADSTQRTHWKMFHSSLRDDPEKFRQHYNSSVERFYDILAHVEKSITGVDTSMREAVDPETKLAATLRYLTVGGSYRVIAEEFHLGRSTVSLIIRCVCNAIWDSLRSPHIAETCVEEFLKISEGYERNTNFPHCLGTVGGRYIRTKQKSSSNDLFLFHNHYGVAFIALVDSNFFFRYVDVSGYRNENDLFKATSLGAKVFSKSLDLPPPKNVLGFSEPLPYVFLCNDFTLTDSILRPFSQKNLSPEKELFNSRMEKAMAPLDTALRILTNRWAILQRPFEIAGEGMEMVLKACCVLHNYLGSHEGFPPVEELAACPFDLLETGRKITLSSGASARSLFVRYFSHTSKK